MGSRIDASITSQEYEDNINVTLKRLRRSHLNKVIYPYLNISSIRNKFGDLDKIVDGNIGILCIAETKFSLICPDILDITENKCGWLVSVKSHISSRRLNDFKISFSI